MVADTEYLDLALACGTIEQIERQRIVYVVAHVGLDDYRHRTQLRPGGRLRLLFARRDYHRQSGREEHEHQRQQAAGASVGTAELLPDEYAPNGGDHRRALTQSV